MGCLCREILLALQCRFKICRDCYMDAMKDGGICPGCKEPYRTAEYDEEVHNFAKGSTPALPAPGGNSMNSNTSLQLRSQNGEFDHKRWIFETKGTYGYGNAYWPQDGMSDDDEGGRLGDGIPDTREKSWKPLTRVIPMPAGIISPYR